MSSRFLHGVSLLQHPWDYDDHQISQFNRGVGRDLVFSTLTRNQTFRRQHRPRKRDILPKRLLAVRLVGEPIRELIKSGKRLSESASDSATRDRGLRFACRGVRSWQLNCEIHKTQQGASSGFVDAYRGERWGLVCSYVGSSWFVFDMASNTTCTTNMGWPSVARLRGPTVCVAVMVSPPDMDAVQARQPNWLERSTPVRERSSS